jgi:hypothetical protein
MAPPTAAPTQTGVSASAGPATPEPSALTPSAAAPAVPSAAAPGAPAKKDTTWTAVYVDSAGTLALKLGLGESRGLAGAGFWAIGYERGLPAFTDLMTRFTAGTLPPY